MSNLDLDALKRDWTEGNFMDELDAVRAAQRTVPALIQRLREAETRADGNFVSYERVKAKYSQAEARIAQLERVRELVGEIETWEPVQKEMRIALAAVEEPVKL